jgi:hypothetical protein
MVARHQAEAGRFLNVTWPGYAGVTTAMAPGRFSAALNQAPDQGATGWTVLDKALNGGWERGTLSTFIAPPGAGKSMFLVNAGAAALERGLNVLYVTLEMADFKIGLRFDSSRGGVVAPTFGFMVGGVLPDESGSEADAAVRRRAALALSFEAAEHAPLARLAHANDDTAPLAGSREPCTAAMLAPDLPDAAHGANFTGEAHLQSVGLQPGRWHVRVARGGQLAGGACADRPQGGIHDVRALCNRASRYAPPSTAVTMPTGSSCGAMSTRASTSAASSSTPPAAALATTV